MNDGSILCLDNIGKSFFGVKVLCGVSLHLQAGRTLGLVGENGAGKSTLMNILGGVLQADVGTMQFCDRPYMPCDAREAETTGIAFIHQELNLFPNLSIAENLFLSGFPSRLGWVNRRTMMAQSKELLGQVGLDLPPGLRVENLSAGERQLVEIAKAMRQQAKLVILDEPTSSLSSRETDKLFALLDRLKRQGLAMIYISHAMADVRRVCDEVAVLRDGTIIGAGPIAEFDEAKIVAMMVGRELESQFPIRQSTLRDENLLEADHLSRPGTIHEVSLRLNEGEVLGIAGLMGSGRTELARILFGLDSASSGNVRLAGIEITSMSTRRRIAMGMAMLTESRRDDGLCMPASIDENIELVAVSKYAEKLLGVVQKAPLAKAIGSIRDSVQLTPTAKGNQCVRTLSGGNQQKVVLAKWLLNAPRVLILDEPTRGIDVGAKFEIYRLIAELSKSGAGILIISSEIEELIGLCDRILVMSRGEIKDEMSKSEFDRERILRSALSSECLVRDAS